MVDMAHIAGLGCCWLAPEPGAACAFRNDNNAQNASRSSRRYDSYVAKPWAAAIDKAVFPGSQGGPLMHMIAAKAVAFGEALKPEFKTYATKRSQKCASIWPKR